MASKKTRVYKNHESTQLDSIGESNCTNRRNDRFERHFTRLANILFEQLLSNEQIL